MRDATPLRNILTDMGYPQTASPMQTDNKFADDIAHDTVKSKRSKAFDIHYHWVRDRVRQGNFDVYWRECGHNLADYVTKDPQNSVLGIFFCVILLGILCSTLKNMLLP